ncbi:MAG TPA: glycosyl hydrolase family 65 protein [Solirubrobacteraceae bacterium]|nr:glycosyl hydrolase family 65 protein [Solirubrobacteraceae bacterium]
MRWNGLITTAVTMAAAGGVAAPAAEANGSYVLTARSYTAAAYAPTFTGNGLIGVRVPPSGQGYAGGKVPAQSELAGFYAKPTHPQTVSDAVQQRANTPTWSTLLFGDGTEGYSTNDGTTTGWRQSLDLHTGIITTSGTWTAADGHRFTFRYEVFTDRADGHVAVTSLTLIPRYTGSAAVTDEIDGRPATLTGSVTKSWDPARRQIADEVATQTTSIDAAIVSRLVTSADVRAGAPIEVDAAGAQSIGQQIVFPVTAGQRYTITKFVGIDDSQDTLDPLAAATSEAARATLTGLRTITLANDQAWAKLWNGRIDVAGNPTLATDINASEFYLWSNTRDGVPWSISPAGLSSNGYDGHVFWDAETWMYPSLLAQHPDLAVGMDDYRLNRLAAAEQHAQQTGYTGARFPWESALDGTEQIPPPVSVNSEGLYEMHITADIAVAQWQYYLATGDRQWLSTHGYPVLSEAAAFWASKATRRPNGTYHIDHVTGPDEENPNVNDEAYTNVAAQTTLKDAVTAAGILGVDPPAEWAQIAAHLVVPEITKSRARIHPEFAGYAGQLVKQADVTLIQYPWLFPMRRALATNDVNYYVPRTDPGGPSMSDAVNEIDTSALNLPGCASYVYTERSVQPFIRDVFDQFSETRYGGAFTFMTGIGGVLQEFLYGYSGLRWQSSGIRLAPSLTREIGGITLHDVKYRGRVFTITIGPRTTTLSLQRGPTLAVNGRTVTRSITIRTARPDTARTTDAVRCANPTATSSVPGAVPLAAVDGSPATGWQPLRLPATFTTPLTSRRTITRITVLWGRLWPQVTQPNVPPKPSPVRTLRADAYTIQASTNGRTWRTVATIHTSSGQTTDRLRIPPTSARYLRLRLTRGSVRPIRPTKNNQNPPPTSPIVEELAVS